MCDCLSSLAAKNSEMLAQSLSVIPLEGDDVCPHISRAVLQFRHGLVQIYTVLIAKQSVVTQTLRMGTGSDVRLLRDKFRWNTFPLAEAKGKSLLFAYHV